MAVKLSNKTISPADMPKTVEVFIVTDVVLYSVSKQVVSVVVDLMG